MNNEVADLHAEAKRRHVQINHVTINTLDDANLADAWIARHPQDIANDLLAKLPRGRIGLRWGITHHDNGVITCAAYADMDVKLDFYFVGTFIACITELSKKLP